jgi:hypothetical protein
MATPKEASDNLVTIYKFGEERTSAVRFPTIDLRAAASR